jgi:hypothetical protein
MSGLWARPKHGSEIRHKLLTGLRARAHMPIRSCDSAVPPQTHDNE